MRVAEDATKRNIELEKELRDCKQEHCREVQKLTSSNKELRSIIKHALEDMKRENVDLTNALQDRIKLHAPSALILFAPFSWGPSYSNNPLSHPPGDIPYEQSNRCNASYAVSSIADINNHRDGTPMDICSLAGPATKRRRREIATHNDKFRDRPNSRTYLPESGRSSPIQDNYNTDFTVPATGALASIETSGQAPFAAGASSHQYPLLDSGPSQRYHQQAAAEGHFVTNQSIGPEVFRGDARPDSPMLAFESSTRHNVASPPVPQLISGEQRQLTPGQLPWTDLDQGIMEPDFLGAMYDPQPWVDHFEGSNQYHV